MQCLWVALLKTLSPVLLGLPRALTNFIQFVLVIPLFSHFPVFSWTYKFWKCLNKGCDPMSVGIARCSESEDNELIALESPSSQAYCLIFKLQRHEPSCTLKYLGSLKRHFFCFSYGLETQLNVMAPKVALFILGTNYIGHQFRSLICVNSFHDSAVSILLIVSLPGLGLHLVIFYG